MITYYITDDGTENGKILETADWEFSKSCIETEREIVRGHDGQLYFVGEEPPIPLPIKEEIIAAVQIHLDKKVGERGYDNIFTICTYTSSTDEIFRDEALACVSWRDAVWRVCFSILDEIAAGTLEMYTVEEILSELPELVWPEV